MGAEEFEQATEYHFIWPLRDLFTSERNRVAKSRSREAWLELITRWVAILQLSDAAAALELWTHPHGYNGDEHFIVHPTQKDYGWVKKRLELVTSSQQLIDELVSARQVFNTECDCLLVTPKRVVTIECKDKTGFSSEQYGRQIRLATALSYAMSLEAAPEYIEVSPGRGRSSRAVTWSEVRDFPGFA